MDIVPALMITMTVVFYIPEAGGINGDLIMADGTEARIGYASCGPRYPFGTLFEIMVDMSEFGVPQVLECRDRGGKVGNAMLDVVIRTGDLAKDWQIARAWGKRRVPVRIHKGWEAYAAFRQAQHSVAQAMKAEADAVERAGPMSLR